MIPSKPNDPDFSKQKAKLLKSITGITVAN